MTHKIQHMNIAKGDIVVFVPTIDSLYPYPYGGFVDALRGASLGCAIVKNTISVNDTHDTVGEEIVGLNIMGVDDVADRLIVAREELWSILDAEVLSLMYDIRYVAFKIEYSLTPDLLERFAQGEVIFIARDYKKLLKQLSPIFTIKRTDNRETAYAEIYIAQYDSDNNCVYTMIYDMDVLPQLFVDKIMLIDA